MAKHFVLAAEHLAAEGTRRRGWTVDVLDVRAELAEMFVAVRAGAAVVLGALARGRSRIVGTIITTTRRRRRSDRGSRCI